MKPISSFSQLINKIQELFQIQERFLKAPEKRNHSSAVVMVFDHISEADSLDEGLTQRLLSIGKVKIPIFLSHSFRSLVVGSKWLVSKGRLLFPHSTIFPLDSLLIQIPKFSISSKENFELPIFLLNLQHKIILSSSPSQRSHFHTLSFELVQ
jgi:hypothetical protein